MSVAALPNDYRCKSTEIPSRSSCALRTRQPRGDESRTSGRLRSEKVDGLKSCFAPDEGQVRAIHCNGCGREVVDRLSLAVGQDRRPQSVDCAASPQSCPDATDDAMLAGQTIAADQDHGRAPSREGMPGLASVRATAAMLVDYVISRPVALC